LERIGFEEVSSLHITIGGWPIVGRGVPEDQQFYRYCKGWWVRTCLSNSEKHSVLERIRRPLPQRHVEVTLMEVAEELST
jgi:hypothetical protein